jgi:hypothetical protein
VQSYYHQDLNMALDFSILAPVYLYGQKNLISVETHKAETQIKLDKVILKQFQLFLICFHCTGSKRIIKKSLFQARNDIQKLCRGFSEKGPKTLPICITLSNWPRPQFQLCRARSQLRLQTPQGNAHQFKFRYPEKVRRTRPQGQVVAQRQYSNSNYTIVIESIAFVYHIACEALIDIMWVYI